MLRHTEVEGPPCEPETGSDKSSIDADRVLWF